MQTSLRIAALGFVCGLTMPSASALFAEASPRQSAPEAKTEVAPLKIPELRCEKLTLPNGLTVLLHEDHRLPLVAVDLWYHVGPLNERKGRTGFAHLFEHMMFEGSEHVGEKAHFKYAEGAGATDINGTTNYDRTNYFETVPSNQLELALWLESDRMGFLMEGLDRDKLTNQRDVVRNERRQAEGSPYYLPYEEMFHLLFPPDHPYYGRVLGSHADIEAARIADVRDFHQQFYTPNNASIAIAGDFDTTRLKELLTRYFGPIPRGPEVPEVRVTTPPITTQKRATVTDTVKLSQLQIGWLTTPLYANDDADIFYAIQSLGGVKANRLERALVYDRQIAQDASCSNDGLKLTGIASCTVTAKPGVKLEDLEAVVWEEIARLQAKGPTPDELVAAKATSLTYKISTLQSLGGFGGVADTLNQYNQYLGDPNYLAKDLARGEKSTPSTVQAAAAKYLTGNSAVVVYCMPGNKVVHDVPRSPADTDAAVKIEPTYPATFELAQAWRKNAPRPGPDPEVHLPAPKSFTLENGLQVLLLENANLPVVTANLVSRAGGEKNTADKSGLSEFTAAMLTEGTQTRPAVQQAADAQRIGANLESSAFMDSAGASVTVLSNNTDGAIDLLADAVQHPAFREEDVERVRKLRTVGVLQESDSPFLIAFRVGPRLLYGNAPYGLPRAGTEKSLKEITRQDLQDFRTKHFGPKDSALVMVGDLTEVSARKLAQQYFGSWTGAATSDITQPPAPPQPKQRLVIVDKPGSPQTALTVWGIGIPANAADRYSAETMNYTLGGSFGSRINMNLREAHGYTYGAQSGFSMYRQGGFFFAGALVRTDITGLAGKELLMELQRIQKTPPTEAELKAAKDANVHSLPGQFTTTSETARALTSIFVYNRPLDYFSKLPREYLAVTGDGVEQSAQKDLHPEQMVVLAVGDRAKIETGLKDLNLGPIEFRDASGDRLK